jgi:hypothetical protein
MSARRHGWGMKRSAMEAKKVAQRLLGAMCAPFAAGEVMGRNLRKAETPVLIISMMPRIQVA